MELGKENTNMTVCTDFLFKERDLVSEIILLAEELGHATIIVLKRADWGAFQTHPANVESPLLDHLLQALWLTCLSRHFLWFPVALNSWIVHRDHCVLLLSLFPPIAFIHFKCTKGVWPK
jgi:hypothetical protein